MKVEIRKDIDIDNKEIVNECYDEFVDRMLDTITDVLTYVYDVEYDFAHQAASDLSKKEFLEILNTFQGLVEKDKHWP